MSRRPSRDELNAWLSASGLMVDGDVRLWRPDLYEPPPSRQALASDRPWSAQPAPDEQLSLTAALDVLQGLVRGRPDYLIAQELVVPTWVVQGFARLLPSHWLDHRAPGRAWSMPFAVPDATGIASPRAFSIAFQPSDQAVLLTETSGTYALLLLSALASETDRDELSRAADRMGFVHNRQLGDVMVKLPTTFTDEFTYELRAAAAEA